MEQIINVKYFKEKKLITSKELSWPQEYKNFVKEIIKKFEIKGENIKIILILISPSDDTYIIKSQEEFNDYIKEYGIKEFQFLVEKGKKKIEPFDFEKLLDESLFKIGDIDIDIDQITKDFFDNEEYKKKLEKEKINYINTFNKNLEKSFNDIKEEKNKAIQKSINLKLSEYSNLSLQMQKERYNFDINFKKDLSDLQKETTNYFKELNIYFKKQGGGDEHKIEIKFEKKRIEKTLDIKDAKFINIDNIKIKNIGDNAYQKLIFARDNYNSSDDIYFFNNYSNPEIEELTLPGDFEHDDFLEHNASLKINNPKPNQTYKMLIYVKEKKDDEELSDPLEIIIKINKIEDPNEQRKKQANQIYEEIKKELLEYQDLMNKDEIINKLLNNNLNKEEIKNYIISKRKKVPTDDEKAEKVFKELRFYNMNFNREEIIALIKEKNFQKEIVQNWINEKIKILQQQIYDELIKLDNVDKDKIIKEKEKVLKKMVELQFDKEEIKLFYIIDKLYNELEEEYGISGYKDEEEAKQKIRELNCDKELLIEWITNNLFGNEN